jgi:hypothetical protein
VDAIAVAIPIVWRHTGEVTDCLFIRRSTLATNRVFQIAPVPGQGWTPSGSQLRPAPAVLPLPANGDVWLEDPFYIRQGDEALLAQAEAQGSAAFGDLAEFKRRNNPDRDRDGDGIVDRLDALPDDYYNGVRPRLIIVSGDWQHGTQAAPMAEPMRVRVVDDTTGAPMTNAPVKFDASGVGILLIDPSGRLPQGDKMELRTDAEGYASIRYWAKYCHGTNSFRILAGAP